MAAYVPLGSYSTVKVMSPTQVLNVDVVSFATTPTGIFCEYGVPHEAFVASGGTAFAQPLIQNLADAIEAVASQVPCVTGGTFVQDVDPSSGLLTDFVQFFLTYTAPDGRGPFSTTVNVPVNNFFTEETGIGGLIIPSSQSFTAPADQVGTACENLAGLAASS